MSNIMDESTMQVIIEALSDKIRDLQTQNFLLKCENDRLKEKSKNA
jgi:hypothetical protein